MEVSKKNVIDLRKIKPEIKPEIERASIPHSFEASGAKTSIRPIPLLVIGVIGVGLIAYFAVSNNYLASLLFVLAAITLAFGVFKRKGRRVKCTLQTDGIEINGAFTPYSRLQSFWIFYDPPHYQELSIKFKKGLSAGYIKIPLGDENPVKMREMLIKFLPERKQEEGLVGVFAKIVGL